ncbi:MAG: hypothetical protein Q9210_006612 [Variospora velana]
MSRNGTASPKRQAEDPYGDQKLRWEKGARQEFDTWEQHCEQYPECWRLFRQALEEKRFQLLCESRWPESAPISEPHASRYDVPTTDVTSPGSLSQIAELSTSCSSPHLPSPSASPSSVTTPPEQIYPVPRPSAAEGALAANAAGCHSVFELEVQQALSSMKTGARKPHRRSAQKTRDTPRANASSSKVSKRGKGHKVVSRATTDSSKVSRSGKGHKSVSRTNKNRRRPNKA